MKIDLEKVIKKTIEEKLGIRGSFKHGTLTIELEWDNIWFRDVEIIMEE